MAVAPLLNPSPKFQAFTSAGAMAAGYKLYVYQAGTVTPVTIYSDADESAQTNPVVLDARGEGNVWLRPNQSYKFVLKTAADVTVYTVDDVTVGQSQDEGEFDVAATGPFASETISVRYYRYGKMVTLQFPEMVKAGNNVSVQVTFDLTNMPASLRPDSRIRYAVAIVTDNGADKDKPGVINIPASGDATLFLNGATSSFTASTNDTGWGAFSVPYLTP